MTVSSCRGRQKDTEMGRSVLQANVQPEHITAVVNMREQLPLSILGLKDVFTVERKSPPDLLQCRP